MRDHYLFGRGACVSHGHFLVTFECAGGGGSVFSLPVASSDRPAVGLRIPSKFILLSLIATPSKSQAFSKDPLIYTVASLSL